MAFAKIIYALWFRHVLVWKSMFFSSLTSNVFNPLLFLFSFGFGMGALIENVQFHGETVNYLAFIVPGMMAYSGMFTASFETSISAFARFKMQNYWGQVLATPVQTFHLLWGEIVWAMSKAMFAVVCVFIIGYLFGGVELGFNIFPILLLMILGCLCFAACGMVATSFASSFEVFSYFFTFWVTPMFIFSGVFFPVDRFPDAVEFLAYILPMTHLVDMVRSLSLNIHLSGFEYFYKTCYIVFLTGLAYFIALKNIQKRMFS